MSLNEKLLSDFSRLGEVRTKEANAALQVYLELCEVRKYWNVEYRYHDALRTLYFTASRHKSESASIFVPKCSNEALSFSKMQSYFQLCEGCDVKSVYLVLVSSDSTCVYYQISDGLQKPESICARHSRSNKQERLDAVIRKHRDLISQAALCGTSLTIQEASAHNSTNQEMP